MTMGLKDHSDFSLAKANSVNYSKNFIVSKFEDAILL